MKNPTVKEFIEQLSKCNQDAIICRHEFDSSDVFYSSVEMIKELENEKYINDSGDDCQGNIVAIF